MKEALRKVPKKDLKAVCVKFFYWWYNQPGSNTEQGFDDWYNEQLKTPQQ